MQPPASSSSASALGTCPYSRTKAQLRALSVYLGADDARAAQAWQRTTFWRATELLGTLTRSPVRFSNQATAEGRHAAVRVPLGHFDLPGLRRIAPFHSLVAVGHASVMNDILRHPKFERGFEFDEVARLLGSSVLTERGAKHKQLRAAVQRAFVPTSVEALGGTLGEEISALSELWKQRGDRVFDLRADMHRLTLRIICRTMFGQHLDDHLATTLDHAVTESGRAMYQGVFQPLQFLKKLPTPTQRRFGYHVRFIRQLAEGILTQHRRRPRSALLDALLGARLTHCAGPSAAGAVLDAHGEWVRPLTHTEVVDEICDVLLAGHITTANLMTFMFHALARLPEWQETLRGVSGMAEPQAEATIDHVWLESLRLYPTAAFLARHAQIDTQVGSEAVARGTMVIGVPYAIQRNPVEWERPNMFDPDRFARDPLAERRLVAFGTGVHVCLGKHLAALEAKMALKELFSRFRMTAVHNRELALAEGILVEPGEPVWVRAYQHA